MPNCLIKPHKYLLLFILLVLSLFCESAGAENPFELPKENRDSVNGKFADLARLGEKILDFVTWEKKFFVFTVYPSLSMSPRNGFEYGVMPAVKWNSARTGKANTLAINAETSTKGMLQLQVEHEWYFNSSWLTSGEAYVNSREDQFWVGPENVDYYFDRNEMKIEWDILNNIKPDFWLGMGILISRNHFEDKAEAVFEEEDMNGSRGGLLFGLGPKLVLDTRNRTLSPQEGAWVRILPTFAGLGGIGDYRYFRITVDARKYISLKNQKTTFAFQTICDYAENEVPFYEMPQLGGKRRLRGIGHPLRETGDALWLARAEIRKHLWWRFGVVAFAGVGETSDNFQNLFSNVISSVGGGLRFRMLPNDPLNVRCDFGVSSIRTTGFFISLKESF